MREFTNVSDQTRKTMSHIKQQDTSIEVTLRKALWKEGIRYRKNYKKLPGKPDIVLTKHKIAIFCDSEFFHGKDWEVLRPRLQKGNNPGYWVNKIQKNIERDNAIDKQLLFLGWTVIHFWGTDILKKTEECVRVIQETIFDNMMWDIDMTGGCRMGKLSELPNIGKEVERQLNEVNIETYEDLKNLGAEQAWLKIQEIDSSACIHRLLALEGAICGVKKNLLPDTRKAELKEFYNWHKK